MRAVERRVVATRRWDPGDAGPRRAGPGERLVVRAPGRTRRAMEMPVHREIGVELALAVGGERVVSAAADPRHVVRRIRAIGALDVRARITDTGVRGAVERTVGVG